MTTEIAKTSTQNPNSPESWRTFGTCSITRRTVIEEDQNPLQITASYRSDAEAALREAFRWLQPLSREAALGLLSQLYLKTVRAGTTDEDFRARIAIYARELERYPADIAKDAINGWRGQFFPTWGELAMSIEADRRIAQRRRVVDALEEFLVPKAEPVKTGKPVDDEFIEKMRAKYRRAETEQEATLTPEQYERIKRVDEQFGEAAKAPNGKWRPISELAKLVTKKPADSARIDARFNKEPE